MTGETIRKKLPEEIELRLKRWHHNAALFKYSQLGLGILAIVSSVTVASRLFLADSLIVSLLAWIAAIASTLLTSLTLETRAIHTRQAWRILNEAVLRYRTEANYTIEQLNKEYKKGEDTIGYFEVNLPQ